MANKPKGNHWAYKEWAPSVKLTTYDRINPEFANREHDLFHLRYFESRPLEPG